VAEKREFDEVAFPALLRAARRIYGSAIRASLAEAGCDDMPRNGSYVVGAIARTGAPLSQIIKELGVSKQAAGQLVDTLVTRGYLDRCADPEDRRRLTITLTERGRAAAAVIRSAVEQVDAYLVGRVGAEFVAHARAALAALIDAYDETDGHDRGISEQGAPRVPRLRRLGLAAEMPASRDVAWLRRPALLFIAGLTGSPTPGPSAGTRSSPTTKQQSAACR
jgi:DNA-binding MarR family transcriptional regulator